jgi:hypothetical protein
MLFNVMGISEQVNSIFNGLYINFATLVALFNSMNV